MKTDAYVLKPVQIITAILAATLALALLLAFSAGMHTQAAPLRNAGTGSDPRIQTITVTASLPISDTHPGDGIPKTVYFNNAVPGVITLTFEISGTPTLTLTAGAAFAEPERTLISTGPLWDAMVTYSVGAGAGDYSGVVYTVSNTNALQTVVPITYMRDVVAPTLHAPVMAEDSAYLYVTGTSLYYTNTMSVAQAFEVRGQAADALSGLRRVAFAQAFGNTPGDDLSPAFFAGSYTIPGGSTESGVLTATVYDRVGNAGSQTYTYQLDAIAPTATVTAPATWPDLTPIPVTWQAGDSQSGIARTRLFYRRVPTDTEWQDSGLEQAGISGAFGFTPGDYLTYTFAAQTTDNVGNVSVWPVTGTQVIVKRPIFRVYLPLTLRHWTWWYQYDTYEPNDTPAQAYGPLVSEQVYKAYIWDANDQNDYYYFTPSTTSAVQILLSHISANCDYDLYVYYYDEQYHQVAHSNQSGNIDESVGFTPVAGRKYYIRVYPYSGFSSQQSYYLKTTYQ